MDNLEFFKMIKFIRYVLQDYPKQFIILICFVFLSSILEVVGIITLLPVVHTFVASSNSFESSYPLVIRLFEFIHLNFHVEYLYILLSFLFIAKGVAVFFTHYYQQQIYITAKMDMRKKLFRNIFFSDWAFFVDRKVGELGNIIVTQTNNACTGLKDLSVFIVCIGYACILLLTSLLISWEIVLLSFMLTVVIYALVHKVFSCVHGMGHKVAQYDNEINQVGIEGLSSLKYVKAAVLEKYFDLQFERAVNKTQKMEKGFAKVNSLLGSIIEPLVAIVALIILYFSLTFLKKPFEEVVVLVFVFHRIGNKLAQISKAYAGTLYRLSQYEMCRSLNNDAVQKRERSGDVSFDSFSDCIELRNVSFAYTSGMPVLANINLKILRGEFVGVVGKSGCGKTTLVDIVIGILRSYAGQIFIDGVDLQQYDIFSWRKKVAYVGQESTLYNISIKENITLGCDNINMQEVCEVACAAHIHDFIETLPHGYETIVGERGIKLSGGQRQRIALARALYRKPQVLILDEATSNLDNESEALIQNSIDALCGTLTIIAIAHRLKTLERANRIIVIEKGQIIEEGSKDVLVKQNGVLKQLILNGNVEIRE